MYKEMSNSLYTGEIKNKCTSKEYGYNLWKMFMSKVRNFKIINNVNDQHKTRVNEVTNKRK